MSYPNMNFLVRILKPVRGIHIIPVMATFSQGNVYRQESLVLIGEILAAGGRLSTIPVETRVGIAQGLERGVYNHAINLEKKNGVIPSWVIPSFVITYRMTRHMLCDKIRPIDVNPQLEARLFDPSSWVKIAAMPIYELQPGVFAQSLNKISQRKNIEVEMIYSKIKCSNCGKFKVREISQQTRSADESSTPSLQCDGCNVIIKLSS